MAAQIESVQLTQQVYTFPVVEKNKTEPVSDRQPAASALFYFFLIIVVTVLISQTLQIQKLAADTRALCEETTAVQLDQNRIFEDIRSRA